MPSLLFIWWAIGLALTVGFGQGMLLFLLVALGQPLGLTYVAAAQAHGHVQLFGWAGMFALGVGLYFLPRLRGSPAPSPRTVRAAAWLLGSGLALRAVSQPVAAALEPGALRGAFGAALVLSGLLELLGGGLATWALVDAARRGPPLAGRAGLVAVLPFALAFFVALLLGLAANTLLLLAIVGRGSPFLAAGADWQLVHLGLIGMLVPISAAISARTFPLYLRLRVPPGGELYVLFGLLLVGFLLRASTPLDLPGLAGTYLPALGSLLEGVALIMLAVVVDVPFRVTRRVPAGQEGPPLSELRAAERLIVSAYLWLACTGLLLVIDSLALLSLVPRPPIDAERHALGAGFVTLLIFGMAVRLLPGFAGRRLYSAGLVWATLWLGNAAAFLRVAPLFLERSPASTGLLTLAGLLALAAVGCLGWNLWRTMRQPPAAPAGS
jgi:uncharacterized protein involved in response to NO